MNTENAAVKWIYQQVMHNGVPMEAGQKPSLCLLGSKRILCVVVGYPVRVVIRKADDWIKYRQVFEGTPTRPVEARDAARRLLEIGTRLGVTAAAEKILRRVADGDTSIGDEADFRDEEYIDLARDASPPAWRKGAAAPADQEPAPVTPKKADGPKNSAGLPAVPKKSAAPVPEPKPARARVAGATKGPTIGGRVVELLNGGQEPAAAAKAIAAEFPGTKFAAEVAAGKFHMFNWYRKDAEKRGLLVKS